MASSSAHPSAESTVDLAHYGAVLVRRWRIVVAITVLGVLAVVGYLFVVSPTYQATATVSVNAITSDPFDATKSASQLLDMTSEAQIARSVTVAQLAAKHLSPAGDPTQLRKHVQVTAPPSTTNLQITYSADSAKTAAKNANAVAAGYLDYRRSTATAQQKQSLTKIAASLAQLRGRLAGLEGILGGTDTTTTRGRDADASRTVVTNQINQLTAQQSALSTMAITPGNVVSQATAPDSASAPRRSLYLGAGFLVALVLGCIGAFIRERFDDRVQNAADLARASGAPFLAAVLARRRNSPLVPVAIPDERRRAEPYRLLRARLLPELKRRSLRSVLVVDESRGIDPGAAANIAVALARAEHDVVLIVPDWSSPRATALTAELQLAASSQGLAEVIGGEPAGPALRESTVAPRLSVLAGTAERDELDPLLAGDRFGAVVGELIASDWFVVIDGSAKLSRPDLLALGTAAAASLIVADRAGTRRATVAAITDELRQLGNVVLGCLLVRRGHGRSGVARIDPPAVAAADPVVQSGRPAPGQA
jgi:capsular polysaccharide biosynthesis protein